MPRFEPGPSLAHPPPRIRFFSRVIIIMNNYGQCYEHPCKSTFERKFLNSNLSSIHSMNFGRFCQLRLLLPIDWDSFANYEPNLRKNHPNYTTQYVYMYTWEMHVRWQPFLLFQIRIYKHTKSQLRIQIRNMASFNRDKTVHSERGMYFLKGQLFSENNVL